MRKAGTKILSAIFILLIAQCNLFKDKSAVTCQPDASAYPYVTAMGKGRGVIFRINFPAKSCKPFTIDSFYVNAQPIPFATMTSDTLIALEATYYKSVPEPSLNADGLMQSTDLDDPILMQQKYDPSYLVINRKGHLERITISKYKIISE